jgi:hypothetical protein
MVMTSDIAAFTPASDVLRERSHHVWLSSRERKYRAELWRGLRLVLRGLRALHRHRLLHRRVCAENLFCETNLGPRSFRLGGFEWSVRLGVPAMTPDYSDWSVPPEFVEAPGQYGYSMDTDWFGFGMLAARMLVSCEHLSAQGPVERRDAVHRLVNDASHLTEAEQALVARLLPREPERRLGIADRLAEVEARIEAIIDQLTELGDPSLSRPLVVALNTDARFLDRLRTSLRSPGEAPAAVDAGLASVVEAVQDDLKDAQIAPFGRDGVVLVGRRLRLALIQWQVGATKTWDFAFAPTLFPGSVPVDLLPLPSGRVRVMARQAVSSDRTLRRMTSSWSSRIGDLVYEQDLTHDVGLLFDFLRCSNQLELLMRSTEMFRYTLLPEEEPADGHITIAEIKVEAPPSYLASRGMVDYYDRKLERADDDESTNVLLFADNELMEAWADVREQHSRRWRIVDVNSETNRITLAPAAPTISPKVPPSQGVVRPDDLHGQLQLIFRRNRAIRDLKDHYYLLKALAAPSEVSIDTQAPLTSRSLKSGVDKHKEAIIDDILRVRPIYALQGPPGTGKTTLVAHLVSHILSEDPVSQILITAPTNHAVDVLRRKVASTAEKAVADARGTDRTPVTDIETPFAVRLYSKRHSRTAVRREGSAEAVSRELLTAALNRLERQPALGDSYDILRDEWKRSAATMLEALCVENTADPDLANFCELVRLGANVTYCTTSSGDLEELAKGDQSFDWSIVEEAGISHGFDLALPMQAGHRWLLLGDQRQLEPHRIDYFDSVFSAQDPKGMLDGALSELRRLPSTTSKLRDSDWLTRWAQRYNEQERETFVQRSRDYLRTFGFVFDRCRAISGGLTTETAGGCYAATLESQYRMHADIGELISKVYYPEIVGGLKCMSPTEDVTHLFSEPAGIRGKSIVWVDVPWVAEHNDYELTRHSPDEILALDAFLRILASSHDYGDQAREREVAILSPYRQQVRLIDEFYALTPPELGGLRLRTPHRRGGRRPQGVAHTVDQFQGDEAHVVVVSMVRNTKAEQQPKEDPGKPLGFLKAPSRMNVLLSRAQALLVIVGSWNFFEHVSAAIPPRSLLAGARLGEEDSPAHWPALTSELREWFRDGRALKVDARAWVESASPDARRRAWARVEAEIKSRSHI